MWVNYNPTEFIESGTTVKPTNYIYVGKNGNDTTGDGSANYPYLTITKAFSVAASGTTVFAYPGAYSESLTFVSGVYLTSPVKFGVYVTGNHTANFTGTVIVDGVILQSTTGTTLTFSGTGAQNLQVLGGSSINSGSGDAINWTNTNASSKLYFEDGTCNVSTSGASARCFYSTTGASGSVIANRVTFKVNNYDNVCLSVGGAISFSHVSDSAYGQIVMSGTASMTSALVTHTCATAAVLTTNSTGTTTFLNCIDVSTANPIITGAGVFVYAATVLGSTGKGVNSTINGGLGSILLDFTPIKFRSGTLRPTPVDGMFEYDGTNFYVTVGTTRYSIDVTAV